MQIVDKSCNLEDFYNYIDTLFQHVTYHDDLNNIGYIKSIFRYRGTYMRGGKMQTIKSKIDDNDYTISDIFEKYGKKSKPSFSSSIRKNDNLIDNYIDIIIYSGRISKYKICSCCGRSFLGLPS